LKLKNERQDMNIFKDAYTLRIQDIRLF